MTAFASVLRRFFSVSLRMLPVLTLVLAQVAFFQPVQAAIAAPAHPISSAPNTIDPRPHLATTPSVSLGGLGLQPVGSNVNFTVTFDNDPVVPPPSTEIGYGPFIDVVLDSTGADADTAGGPYDGLGNTSITASYLGSGFVLNSTMWVLTFDAAGQATHPLLRDSAGTYVTVNAPAGFGPGDKLVVLRLPFGSFVPDQPPAVIDMTVDMSSFADIGTSLGVYARGGYQYGLTPTDDFCCGDDPTPTLGTWDAGGVTPTLFTLQKTYSGPEGEAVSGPNFRTIYPLRYTLTATIAPGQTMTGLTLIDTLPNNLQSFSLISSSPAGATCTPTLPLATAGGTLTCDWGATAISAPASVTFDFYLPLNTSTGTPVIDPVTGNDVTSCNNVSAQTFWNSPDARDLDESILQDQAGCEYSLSVESISLQKGMTISTDNGAALLSPGDVLQYNLTFQISDYFAFQGITVSDVISDGQHFDASFTPTLSISEHGATSTGTFANANYTVLQNFTGAVATPPIFQIDPAANNGESTIEFRVSDELVTRGEDAQVLGGCVPVGGGADIDCTPFNGGAATATIVFRTIVQEAFSDTFPSGDASVDQGDVLSDRGTVTGSVLNTTNLTPTGQTESDDTSASMAIAYGTITKSVYAITAGGVTTLNPAVVKVAPGDLITYKIGYTLPTSDFENLIITDFLPLPVFASSEVITFTNAVCNDLAADVPNAGKACLGTGDTYHSLPAANVPTMTVDAAANSMAWDYGDYDGNGNPASKIELVFTVTVSNQQFADGLYLTNQANSQESSTQANSSNGNGIVQIQLTQPVLTNKKGIVATDNPNAVFSPTPPGPQTFNAPGTSGVRWSGTISSSGLAANPIDSGLTDADAGDLVTFAIVIENSGTGINGAFDITLQDTLDALAFEYPIVGDENSLNLQIRYGDGTGLIPYTTPAGGAATPADLFGAGIKLADPVGEGVCQAHDPNSGNNVIVITYDLRVKNGIGPGTYVNNATLTNYSGSEGGPDYANPDQTDSADVTIALPQFTKALTGTSLVSAGNGNTQAVIGELITYTLTATFPEGKTPAAQIVDTLDSGLAFVDLVSVTASTGLTSTIMTFDGVGACTNCTAGTGAGSNPLITATGSPVTFNFGDVTNANNDNGTAETITIVYRTVVLNLLATQSGTALNNSAVFSSTGSTPITVSANNVTVVEPAVTITKTASAPVAPKTTFDAGDAFAYTIRLTNAVAGNQVDAFDLTLNDPLPRCSATEPSALTIADPLTAITVTDSLGLVTAADFELSGANATGWTLRTKIGPPASTFDLPYNAARTIDIRVAGTLASCLRPGQAFNNTATVSWTSLDGDQTNLAPLATGLTSDYERTGANGVGAGLDNYAASVTSANTTINAGNSSKSVVATSESHTPDTNNASTAALGRQVAVGEIVRYRVAFEIPEGTTVDLQLRDIFGNQAPSTGGQRFLNDGTARYLYVANGGLSSTTYTATGVSIPGLTCANNTSTLTLAQALDPLALPSASINCVPGNDNIASSETANTDTYGTNDTLYFRLGTVTNADSDNDAEFIVFEFNALVDNNAAGTTSNDLGDAPRDTLQPRHIPAGSTVLANLTAGTNRYLLIQEPVFSLTKTNNLPAGDAGDVVTYTLRFRNINGASTTNLSTAFDVTLVDHVPAKITPVFPATISYAPAACGVFASDTSAGNTLSLLFTSINVNCEVTVTYSGTLQSSVIPGEQLVNYADLNFTSLPGTGTPNGSGGNTTGSTTPGASGAVTGERNFTGTQPAYPGAVTVTAPNDYTVRSTSPITITQINPIKSLVSSTDTLTVDPDLTIGEVARYRLAVLLAEGTSPTFSITDVLPAGMQFLDDNSAKFALVSNGGGITSSTLTCANDPGVAADLGSLPSASVDCDLTGAISGGPFGDGSDVTFSLGDIANTDTDSDAEYIVVEFNARLLNVTGNQAGGTLPNTFTVSIGGVLKGTSTPVNVNVVEPAITLVKDVAPFTVEIPDAGGIATYTVTLQNTGTAPAYNVRFLDTLPAVISLDIPSIQVDTVPTPGASAGNTIDLTVATIPVGTTVIITYNAILQQAVTPEELIANTGTATWTSLTGTPPEERTGVDGAGGLNDYTTSEGASFNAGTFTVAKAVSATSATHTAGNALAVGELVTYDITVTLPEGTTPDLTVTDDLPVGLEVVTGSTQVVSAGFGGVLPVPVITAPGGSGVDLSLVFGSITVTNDNVTANNAFIIRYQARVLNELGVDNADALVNTVTATVGTISKTATQTVNVVEPALNIAKSADASSWAYGQTVNFTLDVTHVAVTSTADAFEIVVTDTIPSGITYVAGSIGAPAGWVSDDTNPALLRWTCSSPTCSLPLAATAALVYQVTVDQPPVPPALPGGGTAQNNVAMTWTSLPGDNNPGTIQGERDGSGGAVNDYTDTAFHVGTLDDYRYAIGNRVWFDTNNNGEIDTAAGEVGVTGVTVQLFAVDGVGNPIGLPQTTTTVAGGYYLFDYLVAGDYMVVIPSDNFTGTGKLVGYWSSRTTMDADGVISEGATPDVDLVPSDTDDNGFLSGGRVVSYVVTLGANDEPLNESDGSNFGVQPDNRSNMTVDFGFYQVALGNLAYMDGNLDGTYNGGAPDSLLASTPIQLFALNGQEINVGPDGKLGSGLDIAGGMLTDANGEYQFSGLPEGTYVVRVTAPADTASTVDIAVPADTASPDANADDNDNGVGRAGGVVASAPLFLDPGLAGLLNNTSVSHLDGLTFNPTVDFGFVNLYNLGNRVWYDTNNDTVRDPINEVGVDAVAVELYEADASNNPIGVPLTTTTNTNGYYLFENLYPGNYIVVLPASNFTGLGALAGYWSSGTLIDGDGNPLEGVTPDPDATSDTDDNGYLAAGRVVSYPVTLGPVGLSEPTFESDLDTVGQGSQPDGRANMTVDFGFYRINLGDLVFGDADKDGFFGAGDSRLQNVTVELRSTNGFLLATDTTDGNGNYLFTGRAAGDYVVQVTSPAGTLSTLDTAGSLNPNTNLEDDDNGIGQGAGVVSSGTVTLVAGALGADNRNAITPADGTTYDPTVDFGFTTLYALGNRVWYDTNNDTNIDAASGEEGIDLVEVELYPTDAAGIPTGPAVLTQTVNGGYYLFDNLESGYYIVVIPVSNFAVGAPLEGYWSSDTRRNPTTGVVEENLAPDPDDNQDSDDNGTLHKTGTFSGAVVSSVIELGPLPNEPFGEGDLDGSVGQGSQPDNQANMTVDFGFYTINLGNLVWNDANNDGLYTAETVFPLVDVELYADNGGTGVYLETSTTDASGFYTFSGLPQGNYFTRIPATEFNPGGTLRDYFSSTGSSIAPFPYEPAPSAEVDTTDSDDNGTETGGTLGLGGYIQSSVFALTPAAEEPLSVPDFGVTNETRVDFGVYGNAQTDLSLVKDDGVTFYTPGGTLTYTITVSNNGPSDVTGAQVMDIRPAQITDWTWTCVASTPNPDWTTYACADDNTNPATFTGLLNLPQGATVTYEVVATIDAAATGQLTNTATVLTPAGVAETNPLNDSDDDIDDPADLVVTKTDNVNVTSPGATLTYVIEVTNAGVIDMTSVNLTDTLPVDVTYQSATPLPTTIAGNVLSWTGLVVPAGTTQTFSVVVRVNPTATVPSITNDVEVIDTVSLISDTATDTDSLALSNTKLITNTVPGNDTTPQVFIGEVVTYQLNLAVPAQSTFANLKALDILDQGLAFVRCVSIDPGSSGNLVTDLPNGFMDACNDPTNPVVGVEPVGDPGLVNQGRRVEFNLGNVTNNSPTATETLLVNYEVVVLDIPANVNGVNNLNNSVTWTWTGGSLVAEAPPLEITEPQLTIAKGADPLVAPYGAPITFTLSIAHSSLSTAPAYDVVVQDVLPPGLAFVPGSVSIDGLAPTFTLYDSATTTLTFTWDFFPLNATSEITFTALFVGPSPVTNASSVAWTSREIDPGLNGIPVQLSGYNIYSTERWYDPLDSIGINNYNAESSVVISAPGDGLPDTGFAPDRVTILPPQPAEKRYTSLGDMWLEIPALGLKMPVTGVPISTKGWDLTWLSNQAGYLSGTTFPGQVGTTGITGHVTLADGTPGPFRSLDKLFWGNQVILHADGYRYIYEVRESRTVLPRDLSVFKQDGYTWLTLVTCKGYVPWLDTYNYRLAVRAVLLRVELDPSTPGILEPEGAR